MERSSSQEELELGFDWCHGLVLVNEESEFAWWRSHQFSGIEGEIATELSVHSWAIISKRENIAFYFFPPVVGSVNLRKRNHINFHWWWRTIYRLYINYRGDFKICNPSFSHYVCGQLLYWGLGHEEFGSRLLM
jgi:hypothetical protein